MIYADEIRITAFGIYMLDYLAPEFTYLDLVSLDCGIGEEKVFHQFCNAATTERDMAINYDKQGRLDSRLKRVQDFVEYLQREEDREKGEFLLAEGDYIMPPVVVAFAGQKPRVLSSARRNIAKLTQLRTPTSR
jgi:hypothetical protein